MSSPGWDVSSGEFLSREDRMRRFGGSKQNGIAPSGQSPNVFIYSDPNAAAEFGYVEEWDATGEVLLYTGDGRVGDQSFEHSRGNTAVRDHKSDGRALRLFESAGEKPGSQEVIQRYVGRMEIDDDEPYTHRPNVPDANGALRSAIVFKLRRVHDETTPEVDRLAQLSVVQKPGDDGRAVVSTIPVEKSSTESFVAEYKALSKKERTRTEAKLQKKYTDYLATAYDRVVCQHQIRIDGQTLYTDLYDEAMDELIEVKSSIDRNTMRLALGQILDYAEIVKPAHRTLVVPGRPGDSLLTLFHAHKIKVVWWNGDTFETGEEIGTT
ncbi:hypothetical protein OG921_16005 [Aldersonia sp. NBC_00410]|uniref:hypothetical protein n=1 Tax=Aldersonia sp. NBC_00410 TaxID=2975954 RepID=UPI00224F3485|nr:hypothetical protein [Aldersonia sp. NBC_00410]MCX5044671.1 hypothetical protein [Aldersonia sp. NBC_00410]